MIDLETVIAALMGFVAGLMFLVVNTVWREYKRRRKQNQKVDQAWREHERQMMMLNIQLKSDGRVERRVGFNPAGNRTEDSRTSANNDAYE